MRAHVVLPAGSIGATLRSCRQAGKRGYLRQLAHIGHVEDGAFDSRCAPTWSCRPAPSAPRFGLAGKPESVDIYANSRIIWRIPAHAKEGTRDVNLGDA